MKVTANFHKKVPVEGIDYASQGYACEIQIEPPLEVREDREKLRRYIEALFGECRARVEAELSRGAPETAERAGDHREEPSRRSSRSNGRNGNGHAQQGRSGNGRSRNGGSDSGGARRPQGNGDLASPKQLNFLRSLAREAGIGYPGLEEMARDEFGTDDLLHLTRKQASALIDQLRDGARR